uniref:Uncharacterized protein n=1 Tax=Hordeum vulgare subsp. vulgare TaxID=112509 RepID=A0A8I6X287_HORVV
MYLVERQNKNNIFQNTYCRVYTTTGFGVVSSNRFKSSTTKSMTPGRLSLGAHARKILNCHRQGHAGSGMGIATTVRP